MLSNLRKHWGFQAFLNWILLRFMFSETERTVTETFIPILRLLVDDKEKMLNEYQQLCDSRKKLPFYASPYQRWWTYYGNFIPENEFALRLLQKHLSEEDFQELAVNYTAERVEKRFRKFKEILKKRNEKKSLHDELLTPEGKKMLPIISTMSQFLVGPTDLSIDKNGTIEMEISDCAMHRSSSDNEPQELSCLYSCKAACEAVFSAKDPMCWEFEPYLPGFGCTLRIYMVGNSVLDSKRNMLESPVKIVTSASVA